MSLRDAELALDVLGEEGGVPAADDRLHVLGHGVHVQPPAAAPLQQVLQGGQVQGGQVGELAINRVVG